jgi:hypothetical protein
MIITDTVCLTCNMSFMASWVRNSFEALLVKSVDLLLFHTIGL